MTLIIYYYYYYVPYHFLATFLALLDFFFVGSFVYYMLSALMPIFPGQTR
jgi:hypothetical protein